MRIVVGLRDSGIGADVELDGGKWIDLLLQFSSKEEVVGFSEYIDGILENAEIRKLNEASYSEVFTLKHNDGTTNVLKIVPFLETSHEKDNSMSNLEDILQEIRISRVMANIQGFADFQGYHPLQSS